MMKQASKHLWLAGLLALIGATAGRADAAFVTYTETVTGSGTLGATAFTNALLTITQTADTNNIVAGTNFYAVNAAMTTVNVVGVGLATITIPMQFAISVGSTVGTYAGSGTGTAGAGGIGLLAVVNPTLTTYNLASSIGPVSGRALIYPGMLFASDQGNLVINSVTGTGTFQATVAPAIGTVPEPSSLALCLAAGAIGLGARSRRRIARRA